MKGKSGLFGWISHATGKKVSKCISLVLILSILVTIAETMPGGGNLVYAAQEELELNVTDLVQVQVGDEVSTLQLYNKGVYEAKMDISTVSENGALFNNNSEKVTVSANLLVNGNVENTKTIEVKGEDGEDTAPVYFRVQEGKMLDSVNNDDKFPKVSFAGEFPGITFLDPGGNPMTIAQWAPEDSNAVMNYMGGGIYAAELSFEALTEDIDVAYKITPGCTWENDFGEGGGSGNIEVTIPTGTESLIIWTDILNKVAYDSVRTKPFAVDQPGKDALINPFQSAVSLIGTVRELGEDSWDLEEEGWEFTQISENLYLYQKTFANAGTYQYKAAFDYAIWYNKTENIDLKIENNDTNVIFLYDAETQELYDSVNNKEEIELEISSIPRVVANKNGTIKFNTVVEQQNSAVFLLYDDYDSVSNNGLKNMKQVQMSYQPKGNYFTTGDLFLGDEALNVVYYYLVNGVKTLDQSEDQLVDIDGKKYCKFTRGKFNGRTTNVPGTFPGPNWNAESNEMTYIGNGLYKYTFSDVPPGNYEYKISHGDWNESYGAKGVSGGSNIKVVVRKKKDVTVYYSDFSHYSRTSVDYEFGEDVKLTGSEIPTDTTFDDSRLTGIYSVTVDLASGTYDDLKIEHDGNTFEIDAFVVARRKLVTFYYDPSIGIYYHNASDVEVENSNIYYDTKDVAYKSIYGAVETNQAVTYSIQTGGDAKYVTMVIKGGERPRTISMSETANNDGTKQWSTDVTFDELGEYNYFFVISNGAAITIYGDDDGYYGTGQATDLLNAIPYDQIVYQDGYETPDWMKDAVIYQIFPDRFFDADISNNRAQISARGAVDYEYVTDWYLYPENPEQMVLAEEDSAHILPAEAYQGDGEWHNDIYGGDLKGVTKKIDYLEALGVNVIYLNPVFKSISTHRYDASDYGVIDPILGTEGDFDELVETAEAHGMKVVLDGVFNHVADDSKYFDRYYKYLEEVKDSDDIEKKIGAYPYWAYVYDLMNEEEMNETDAKTEAESHFRTEYGITDFVYTGWFDFYGPDEFIIDDDKKIVQDTIGLRKGKDVYSYDCWWGYDSMPVILATDGSEYQTMGWKEEIIGTDTSSESDGSITQYWLERGMNGWRLDVANEVSDETWQHFRKSVKSLDKENVIIGEIWTDAVEYLMGDMYDSVMNYVFRDAALKYVMGGDADEYNKTLEKLRERYPKEAFYAMMNLVGSHDTTRVLSYLDGIEDSRKQKDVESAYPTYEKTSDLAKQQQYLAAFLQFTYPGAPTVYYGDEIGMTGSDDPDDRRGMTWGKGNKDIVTWYAKLGQIRKEYAALRTGDIEVIDSGSDNVVSFIRSTDTEKMVVLANNSEAVVNVTVSANDLGATECVDVVADESYSAENGKITISVPALSGVILTSAETVKTISVDEEKLKAAYDPDYIVADAKVVISQTDAELKKGDKLTLTASGRGVITWSTTNSDVAVVDKGVVTAVGGGTANIIATQEDGMTAVCKVTIEKIPDEIPDKIPNKISLNKTEAIIERGKTLTLNAVIDPKDVVDSSVKWSTSNAKVAVVNEKGVVEAKSAGEATITVRTVNDKTATCKVTVIVSAKKVYTLPSANIVKGKTKTLTASVVPKNTTDKITWKSSKPSVARVDAKGKVKGVKTGNATITATATSGQKATCKVKVVQKTTAVTKVKFSKKTLSLKANDIVQIKAAITPKKATGDLKFSSSKKAVAAIDKNGVITAKKAGTTTIRVKVGKQKATCKVTVKVPATKVTLNKKEAKLSKGKTLRLKATITPKNATDKLTWSTNKKNVATVNKKGVVTAKKKGTAKITVKASSGKKATCKVTVK